MSALVVPGDIDQALEAYHLALFESGGDDDSPRVITARRFLIQLTVRAL